MFHAFLKSLAAPLKLKTSQYRIGAGRYLSGVTKAELQGVGPLRIQIDPSPPCS